MPSYVSALYTHIWRSMWVSLSVSLSACRCVCLSLFVYLSFCLSICLLVCLSVILTACLSVCLFHCLSVYPTVCLSVSLSVCLSVPLHLFPLLSLFVSRFVYLTGLPVSVSVLLFSVCECIAWHMICPARVCICVCLRRCVCCLSAIPFGFDRSLLKIIFAWGNFNSHTLPKNRETVREREAQLLLYLFLGNLRMQQLPRPTAALREMCLGRGGGGNRYISWSYFAAFSYFPYLIEKGFWDVQISNGFAIIIACQLQLHFLTVHPHWPQPQIVPQR